MKCNICGSEMEYLEKLSDQPVEVTKVYSEPKQSQTIDIKFYQCLKCTHGQIQTCLSQNYYEEYQLIHNPTDTGIEGIYTDTLLSYYDEQFEELSHYVNAHEKLLDIGCGPAILLKKAVKYFKSGIGVEPSKVQADYAAQCNPELEIVNGFFDDTIDIPNESLDGFISTQVFEHLENAKAVLDCANSKMKTGAVGFIEIPNGQKIMRENRYFDIFPEHVNYFTPFSLMTLVRQSGFDIIKISETFNANFLVAFIRKISNATSFSENRKKHLNILSKLFAEHKAVSLWGAGTKSRSFLPLLKEQKILHLFDSSKTLQGGFICNIPVPIEAPDMEKISESDLIIIFATNYTEEIVSELRNKYMYHGEIVAMNETTAIIS